MANSAHLTRHCASPHPYAYPQPPPPERSSRSDGHRGIRVMHLATHNTQLKPTTSKRIHDGHIKSAKALVL